WSPDGQFVAYVTWNDTEGGHVYRLRADGSGQPERLTKVAAFYDQEVESTTESLTALIEPVMIGVLGGIVGSMIIALYLPMFRIFDLIK
ncbi:MAG: type II secretion system F family protein, partial [Actinomycetota bacterium]